MLTACGAISATIILIIFNTLVVGGITDGVSRDIQDVQTGDLYISHNKNLFLERTDNKLFKNDLSEIEIKALFMLTIFFI